jgi:diguanylate cyclase (GGDEF)-like protein/PAS domain S-box-containing protein
LTTLAGLMGRRSREGRRWGIGVLIIVGILGLPTAGLVATNHLLRQSGEQRANDSNAVAASTLAFEVGQSYRQRLALFSEIPDRPDVAAGLSDGDPALTAQALRAALIDGGFCQLELRSPGIRAMSVSSGGPCWAPPAPATGAAGIRALGATMVGSRAFVGFDVLGDFPGHPGASLQAVFPVDALTATVLPGTGIHATVVDGLRIVSSSNPALVGRLIASPFARAMALAGRPASATLYSPSLRTEVLDAFRPVPGTGLGVFYSETTAVAYAATNHVSRVLLEGYLVLLAIIVSLAGLVIVMLRRRDRAAQRSEDELRASEERYRLLIAGVTDYAILALDVDGMVTTWNSGAERIKGYRAEEIIGRHCSVFYPPEDISAGIPAAELVAATANGSVEAEGWRLRKDGTRFWGSVVITAIFDDDHHPAGFTKVTRDITERHTHAQLLAHERRRLLAAESIGRVGSWELDLLTKTAVWSDSFLDLYGQDRGDLAAARDCVHPDDLAKLDAAILGCATTGAPFQVRYRIKRVNDGELRWLEALGERDAAGPHTSLIGATIDVTDQVLRSRADTEARFREVFDTAPIGMAIIDLSQLSSGLLRVNPAMCALTGRTDDELVVLDLDAISDPADAAADHRMLARLRSGQDEVVQGEKRFARPDGSTVWGKFSMSAVSAGDGTDAYAVCLVENITARKQAEEALVHESLHDPLTGLANRTLLHDRIDHALAASTRSHRPIGLVYIDLDGFKQVNDSDGHAAGDEVLIQIADRLRLLVRPADTVGRLAGDEFVLVCVDIADLDGVRSVASRVLEGLRAPFHCSTGTHRLTASIGLATSEDNRGTDQLLAAADAAMYTAKRTGKDRIATPRIEELARSTRSARLLPELHDAIRDGQLVMYGQPVVDLATGVTVAVETLIRWRHPVRGILPPSEFLDVAEHSPLMIPLGQRALTESCRMAAAWSEQLGRAAPRVHVNVSGRQLETGHLTPDVLNTLATYSLPASRLVLELTETHMPDITKSLLADLNHLRDRGVRIALDDVGTGHSSLTHITELPVDILKIDLRFTAGLGADPACDAIVRAVLGLGQAMGLSVVAEGVETPHQAELLRAYGCDTVQGYLYSPPRPETELLQYLGTHTGAVDPRGERAGI